MTRLQTMVIVPAHNEGPRIGEVIREVRRQVSAAEVLVIDDGSTDDTSEAARGAGARVIRHPINLGYSLALQEGYRQAEEAGVQVVVQMDADGQHDAGSIECLLETLDKEEADVVIGSRFLGRNGYRMPFERRLGQRLFRAILVLLTGRHFSDPTSGFQVIRGSVLGHLTEHRYPKHHPDAAAIYFLWKSGLRVIEAPALFHPSPAGKTSLHEGLRPFSYVAWQLLELVRVLILPIPAETNLQPGKRPVTEAKVVSRPKRECEGVDHVD